MNSTDKAYEHGKFILSFIDSECCNAECESSDFDDAIEEYKELLRCAMDSNNQKEVSMLRKDIQRCRARKREFKRLIENKRMEIVHT